MKIIVSSCLLGNNCKYDGTNNKQEDLLSLSKRYELIPVCPEVMGGLSIPRLPAEIINGKVINLANEDVSAFYQLGASKVLQIALENECQIAILKSNSPSCGYGTIYDGTFCHHLINGNGITSELLFKNGVVILNEKNYHEKL